MKKIMEVISDSNLGGAGRVLCEYFSSYDKEKYEVSVAIPKGSVLLSVFQDFDVKIHEIEGMADRSYHKEDVKALARLFREEKPDLIHTHGAFSGRMAGKKVKIPVVYSRHSVFPVSQKQKLLAPIMGAINTHYADGILAVSPAAADNLVETGIPRKKIDIVYNGVRPMEKTSEEKAKALRESLGLGDLFTFGILARLEYYKGHRLLLEACQILKEQGHSFRVLIAGSGTEDIQAEIQGKALEDKVLFLGFWKEIPELLSILDVQLNCSFGTEATSIALLEGMSLGLPSVVSDYGGNPQVISHGENGLVFPSENPEKLAQAMAQMITDQSFREKASIRAREIYQEKFTALAFARETEKFYEKVWNRR
ncbi:MAG: glycosyltransferase family 4 protein [Eubacteriales bacterium]